MIDDYDDNQDGDPNGRPVKLSRNDFNRIMSRTLHAMGDKDPERVESEAEWDEEYEDMKYFTPKQFKDLCDVGVRNYNHSKKADCN